LLPDYERTDWAATELRIRLGHARGAFPLDRIAEAIPVRLLRVHELGATILWNHQRGAVVSVDDALSGDDSRWAFARGVGGAVLHFGWLTGAPIVRRRSVAIADAQTSLFALRLLAPFEVVHDLIAGRACSGCEDQSFIRRISRDLQVPTHVARRQLAGLLARSLHHSRALLCGPAVSAPAQEAVRSLH
jgi:hypothetical protein